MTSYKLQVRSLLGKESPASLRALEAAEADGLWPRYKALDFSAFLAAYLSSGAISAAVATVPLDTAALSPALTEEQRALAAELDLSEREADQYLSIFQALDTNGDGTVKVAEVVDVLLRSSNRVRDDEDPTEWGVNV